MKNLQAFQVLQNAFHKASDSMLCTKVLSSIRAMWAWNARNFFLLEWTLQPISQFVEIVPLKPTLVQMHFFQLLETLVFELHYVPHEILRKVQRLIKESPEPLFTLVALQSILRIAGGDPLFTDIFRDSGLLGLLLAQLRKQAKILRKSGASQEPQEEKGRGGGVVSLLAGPGLCASPATHWHNRGPCHWCHDRYVASQGRQAPYFYNLPDLPYEEVRGRYLPLNRLR